MRIVAALLAFALAACQTTTTTPATSRLETMPRHDEWVDVGKVRTYVVYPEVSQRAPAIVVIHENRGLTDWVRTVADRLAENGYIAVAPDLLSGMAPGGGNTKDFPTEDAAREAIGKLDRAQTIENLREVISYARRIPAANGQVSVGGFCWGGARTWDVANNVDGIAATYVFYGTGPQDAARPATLRRASACVPGKQPFAPLMRRAFATPQPPTSPTMKRLLLLVFALGITASLSSAQDSAKARLDKSPRHLEWVTIKHGDRDVKCFIGFPEVKNKATAIVLIHEIFGLSDWVRGMVDQFAEAGYIAIAPDFLSGMGPNGGGSDSFSPDQVRGKIQGLPDIQVMADVKAAADYVTKLPAANGKVAVGGFCWGGARTFNYAATGADFAAGLVFYGQAPKPEQMSAIKVPIYGFYGGNDARITAAVPEVTAQMKTANKFYEPITYEGAGHGFMRSGEQPDATEPNKKAREESWKRIKTILAEL